MSDPLDQLDGLDTKIRSVPETISQLRNRVARRRRRRHLLAAGAAALVAALAVTVVLPDGDDGTDLRTVDDSDGSTPLTTEPRTSTQPAVLPAGALISGESGIQRVDPEGLERLSDQPTSLAFSLGDGLVVAQGAEVGDVYPLRATGPILVLEDGAIRELDVEPGTEVQLHDAGIMDSRPMALVTVRRGSTPEDTEEVLSLIDVETGVRSDLGIVGGWESGLSQARLAGPHIVTVLNDEARSFLIVRSFDGAVEWEAPESVVDASMSVAVVDDEVLLLTPGFGGAGFQPRLGIRRFDLGSGASGRSDTLALHPVDGAAIDDGFCFYAESSAGRLLCDRSSAGPIEIDLDTGDARAVGGLEAGRVTLPRADGPTAGGAPSQSVAAAGRDGVVPEVAAMPISDRVEPHERIDAAEGTWLLSRLTRAAQDAAGRDGCIVGDAQGTYGTSYICASEYGEVLLLDTRGEIIRAYPMPSTPPSWIYLGDEAVVVGHIGDGGLPSSTLVRIDRQTLTAQVVVFPQPDSEIAWPRGWHVATAAETAAYSGLVAIGPELEGSPAVSEIGRVAIDAAAIDDLFRALG